MDFGTFITIGFAVFVICVSMPDGYDYHTDLGNMEGQLARIADNLERIARALEDKEEGDNG